MATLVTDIAALGMNEREPWPTNVKLYQPCEGQILLPDYAACLGVKAFLRMCHLKYSEVSRTNAENMSPSGKVPFLQIGSLIISEPEPIMSCAKDKGYQLSEQLTDSQQVEMKAYMSLVKNILIQAELYLTWQDKEMYKRVTAPRYGQPYPWPLNKVLPFRKKWYIQASLGGTQWANKSMDKVCDEVEKCCGALSEKLGDQVYLFGDKPTEVDALIFGHLYSIITTELPVKRFLEIINKYKNLVNFCKRIDTQYFKEYRA